MWVLFDPKGESLVKSWLQFYLRHVQLPLLSIWINFIHPTPNFHFNQTHQFTLSWLLTKIHTSMGFKTHPTISTIVLSRRAEAISWILLAWVLWLPSWASEVDYFWRKRLINFLSMLARHTFSSCTSFGTYHNQD